MYGAAAGPLPSQQRRLVFYMADLGGIYIDLLLLHIHGHGPVVLPEKCGYGFRVDPGFSLRDGGAGRGPSGFICGPLRRSIYPVDDYLSPLDGIHSNGADSLSNEEKQPLTWEKKDRLQID